MKFKFHILITILILVVQCKSENQEYDIFNSSLHQTFSKMRQFLNNATADTAPEYQDIPDYVPILEQEEMAKTNQKMLTIDTTWRTSDLFSAKFHEVLTTRSSLMKHPSTDVWFRNDSFMPSPSVLRSGVTPHGKPVFRVKPKDFKLTPVIQTPKKAKNWNFDKWFHWLKNQTYTPMGVSTDYGINAKKDVKSPQNYGKEAKLYQRYGDDPHTEGIDYETTTYSEDPGQGSTEETHLWSNTSSADVENVTTSYLEYSPSTQSAFLQELQSNLWDYNMGPLSVAMIKLSVIVASKNETEVEQLTEQLAHYVLINLKRFEKFGREIYLKIIEISTTITNMPVRKLRSEAAIMYSTLKNRYTELPQDINTVIDYADKFYTKEEKATMFKALEDFKDYTSSKIDSKNNDQYTHIHFRTSTSAGSPREITKALLDSMIDPIHKAEGSKSYNELMGGVHKVLRDRTKLFDVNQPFKKENKVSDKKPVWITNRTTVEELISNETTTDNCSLEHISKPWSNQEEVLLPKWKPTSEDPNTNKLAPSIALYKQHPSHYSFKSIVITTPKYFRKVNSQISAKDQKNLRKYYPNESTPTRKRIHLKKHIRTSQKTNDRRLYSKKYIDTSKESMDGSYNETFNKKVSNSENSENENLEDSDSRYRAFKINTNKIFKIPKNSSKTFNKKSNTNTMKQLNMQTKISLKINRNKDKNEILRKITEDTSYEYSQEENELKTNLNIAFRRYGNRRMLSYENNNFTPIKKINKERRSDEFTSKKKILILSGY